LQATAPRDEARADRRMRKHAATKWCSQCHFSVRCARAVLIRPGFRRLTASAPNASSGPTAVWRWRTRDSGEYRMVNGQVERRKKPVLIRGLNWNHNPRDERRVQGGRDLGQYLPTGVFREFYLGLLNKRNAARDGALTLARKIAAITLKIWKKGESVRFRKNEDTSSLSAHRHRNGGSSRSPSATERSGSRVSIL